MHFPDLTIVRKDDPKGRTFTVHYVASIEAPKLSPPAGNGALRPVLLAYAGSASAVRAFTANLRAGYPAATRDRKYELLRSAGYRYQLSSPAGGQALVLAYLPDLFHLQPGVQDDAALRFVSAPPRWWVDRQEEVLAPEFGSRARELALAMPFVARLDARTPLTIANDPEFHRGLYRLALEEPWIETGRNPEVLRFDGLEALGLSAPVLCDVPKTTFATFLASATAELLPRQRTLSGRPNVPAYVSQLALNFRTA
jgi:hypothetical protein